PEAEQPAMPAGHPITSPLVGTFYRSPSPEASSFVEVGSHIDVDQVLCIVEAMKVMNEIKSDVAGEVLEVLVENGEPVEYGQPLFLVKTR
ncbi:MAG: acetyl-CoA carboxylase biotin carboxyl carrier protein, partial [Verrucomicrobiota bacterium]